MYMYHDANNILSAGIRFHQVPEKKNSLFFEIQINNPEL